jgi:hypothetical protein
VLPLEQRRVAGRERPSEQRLEVQPGFLEESQVHHLRHPAPISATQPTDIPATDSPATRSRAMGTQATQDTPPTPVLRAMDTQVIQVSPVTPPIPVHRAMATKAARCTLPTPIPVMDTPWLAIRATAPRRTGLLGPSTLSSLLAEFRPKVRPSILDAVRPWRGRTSPQNHLARRKILSVADCETCTRLSSECRHAASENRHAFRQRIVKYLILLMGFSSAP